MEQNRVVFPIIWPAISSKNFLQKYEKYSTHNAVIMILFQHLMVRSPVILCVPSIPSSSHPLTVMYPDLFPCGPGFETFHGFLKIWSGHLVVWMHHLEKYRQIFGCRYVSTGCIRARLVAKDGNGGHWCCGDNCPRPLRPGRRWVEPGEEFEYKNGCSRGRISILKCLLR